MRKLRKDAGVAGLLLELLVAMAVLLILLGMALPPFKSLAQQKSQEDALSALKWIQNAEGVYANSSPWKNGYATLQVLSAGPTSIIATCDVPQLLPGWFNGPLVLNHYTITVTQQTFLAGPAPGCTTVGLSFYAITATPDNFAGQRTFYADPIVGITFADGQQAGPTDQKWQW